MCVCVPHSSPFSPIQKSSFILIRIPPPTLAYNPFKRLIQFATPSILFLFFLLCSCVTRFASDCVCLTFFRRTLRSQPSTHKHAIKRRTNSTVKCHSNKNSTQTLGKINFSKRLCFSIARGLVDIDGCQTL